MGEENWRTVKLPAKLVTQIETLVKIEGEFASHSSFITQAANELLMKHKKKLEIIFEIMEDRIIIEDPKFPPYPSSVIINFIKNTLYCKYDNSENCEHIMTCWGTKSIKKRLLSRGLKFSLD